MKQLSGKLLLLLTGVLVSIHFASVCFACDDPPNHYPDPCSARYESSSLLPPLLPIAEERGFFSKHLVKVKIGPLQTDELQVSNPTFAVAQVSAAKALLAVSGRRPIKIIATPLAKITFRLWTTEPIKSLMDLKDKAVIVGPRGTGDITAAQTFSKHSGIVLKPVVADTVEQQLELIRTKEYRSGIFSSSFDKELEKLGLTSIDTITISFARDVVVTTDRILADPKNKIFLVDFIKSLEAVTTFLQGQREASSVRMIKKTFGINEEVAARAYAEYIQFPRNFNVDTKALGAVLKELMPIRPELEGINVENMVRQEFVGSKYK